MILIGKPYIEEDDEYTYLKSKMSYNGNYETLWYKTRKDYGKYFCTERSDSFVIALLLFAMSKGEDIKTEEPISSRLYSNLVNNLIITLSKTHTEYHKINIFSDVSKDELYNEGRVGTGISCGVDSLQTIYQYTSNNCPENLKVNTLTMLNMGSHGDFGGEKARELYEKRMKRSEQFAKNNKFDFIMIDSNISEYIKMSFVETHTFRNMSAILAIQKLFKVYYYASGIPIWDFEISKKDPAYYDIYTLNMLSNENITFYSTGMSFTRLEKIDQITNYKLSYNTLNVCFNEDKNCGKCEKCVRTLLALEALKKIDLYKNVFDLDAYKKRKYKNYTILMHQKYKKNKNFVDIYKLMKKNNIKIPLICKIKGRILPNRVEIKRFLQSILSQEMYEKLKNKFWKK